MKSFNHATIANIMRYVLRALLFLFLTVLTQVGGVIYLCSLAILRRVDLRRLTPLRRRLSRIGVHAGFYLLMTFLVIPPLAARFGRVPLPAFRDGHLKPRTILTAVLNRNYVRPELRQIVRDVAAKIGEKHPGFQLNYFDANFPFRLGIGPFREKGFPLLPHISHSDGRKLDMGLVYRDAGTNELSPRTPSAIGYGISEGPLPGEVDRPAECRGKWMYSFMSRVWPQGARKDYTFDPVITRELTMPFVKDRRISWIYFETHLRDRLRLGSGKVGPAPCGAVRHDDHFHVTLR